MVRGRCRAKPTIRASRRGRPFLCPACCHADGELDPEGSAPSTPPGSKPRAGDRGSAPSGSCLSLHAAGFAVPRVSPPARCALTAPFHPCLCPSVARTIGGLLSVALSLARDRSGRVGVTHRGALPCSDFPHTVTGCPGPMRGRLVRPSLSILVLPDTQGSGGGALRARPSTGLLSEVRPDASLPGHR